MPRNNISGSHKSVKRTQIHHIVVMTHPSSKMCVMENMDSPHHMSNTKTALQNVFDKTKTGFDRRSRFYSVVPPSIPNDGAPYHASSNSPVQEADNVDKSSFSYIPGIAQKAKCLSLTTSQPSSPRECSNRGSLNKESICLMDDLPRQSHEISQINGHNMPRSSSHRRRQRHGQMQMVQETRSSAASQVCQPNTGAQNLYLDDLKNEIEKLAKIQQKLLKKQKKALRTLKKMNAAQSA